MSRFGRDYIESGRYLQKVFPALGVRFIALTDHYDSFQADSGESGIVLPVKNFINDSYCRDISTKVKSQFGVKRKNGECVSPFAPYGYQKAESNRNKLVVDEYAAEIVRKIFEWKMEGLAVSAIANKLNELGILSPREYKRYAGSNYRGGFVGVGRALWSSSAVKRILTNEMYLGHMVQGKTEKVNYKLKKSVKKPRDEWVRVENTHEAVISEDIFQVVQNLLKADGRISPVTEENSMFMGILFCGDCGEQMVRRANCYKGARKEYYICSTKNRGEGCSRHSYEEAKLKAAVAEVVRRYANLFLSEKKIAERSREMEVKSASVIRFDAETARLKQEWERYCSLCSGLHEDLEAGVVTKEEFARLHESFTRKAEEFRQAQEKQEVMRKELIRNSVLSAGRLKTMQDCAELKEIDRRMLCCMVRRISVYENHRIEIEFYYMPPAASCAGLAGGR